jgi:hypothetical protein
LKKDVAAIQPLLAAENAFVERLSAVVIRNRKLVFSFTLRRFRVIYAIVDDFDRLRRVSELWSKRPSDFSTLHLALKRCFPVPDYVLAAMLGVTASHFSYWKVGKRRPSRLTARFIIVLCLFRIGRVDNVHDLIHAGQVWRTGKLEKLIDSYLAHEAEVIARRKARVAEKEAEVVRKDVTKWGAQPVEAA